MFKGADAGLELLPEVEEDRRLATSHRVAAVRGHLLELAGDSAAASETYQTAARLTTSRPERDYLLRKTAATSG
jgi:predicted RNA polymerase sigma factor